MCPLIINRSQLAAGFDLDQHLAAAARAFPALALDKLIHKRCLRHAWGAPWVISTQKGPGVGGLHPCSALAKIPNGKCGPVSSSPQGMTQTDTVTQPQALRRSATSIVQTSLCEHPAASPFSLVSLFGRSNFPRNPRGIDRIRTGSSAGSTNGHQTAISGCCRGAAASTMVSEEGRVIGVKS